MCLFVDGSRIGALTLLSLLLVCLQFIMRPFGLPTDNVWFALVSVVLCIECVLLFMFGQNESERSQSREVVMALVVVLVGVAVTVRTVLMKLVGVLPSRVKKWLTGQQQSSLGLGPGVGSTALREQPLDSRTIISEWSWLRGPFSGLEIHAYIAIAV